MTITTTYAACACIEGLDGADHDEDDIIEAFQFLIDCGALDRQGFYGHRFPTHRSGVCHA